MRGDWETRYPKLIIHHAYVTKLMSYFDQIIFHHIPREESQLVDALVTLSLMYKVRFPNEAPFIRIDHRDEHAHYLSVEEESDGKSWFHDIKCYPKNHEYPTNASSVDMRTLRRLALKFFLSGNEIIKEIHEGSFGNHANGHAMTKKILGKAITS